MKIGFQGIKGAYSEMAGIKFCEEYLTKNKNFSYIGYDEFEQIFKAVVNDEINYGVIPVENSLAGSIHKNFDLLAKYNLLVVGEVYIHVKHQLLGLKKAKLKDILFVYSHFQALAQCAHNIKELLPNAKIVEHFDTAGSAKYIKEENDVKKASIASYISSKHYNLKVLKKDIQDDENNYTRFFIISKKALTVKVNKNEKYKTSIIFAGKNIAGFLFKALACFALRGINLSKIESRPIPKKPWQSYFYLDFDGKQDEENILNALENLKEITDNLKVLGSYKAGKI